MYYTHGPAGVTGRGNVRCAGSAVVAGDERGAMQELAADAVPQVGLHVLVAEVVPQQEDEQVGLPSHRPSRAPKP